MKTSTQTPSPEGQTSRLLRLEVKNITENLAYGYDQMLKEIEYPNLELLDIVYIDAKCTGNLFILYKEAITLKNKTTSKSFSVIKQELVQDTEEQLKYLDNVNNYAQFSYDQITNNFTPSRCPLTLGKRPKLIDNKRNGLKRKFIRPTGLSKNISEIPSTKTQKGIQITFPETDVGTPIDTFSPSPNTTPTKRIVKPTTKLTTDPSQEKSVFRPEAQYHLWTWWYASIRELLARKIKDLDKNISINFMGDSDIEYLSHNYVIQSESLLQEEQEKMDPIIVNNAATRNRFVERQKIINTYLKLYQKLRNRNLHELQKPKPQELHGDAGRI